MPSRKIRLNPKRGILAAGVPPHVHVGAARHVGRGGVDGDNDGERDAQAGLRAHPQAEGVREVLRPHRHGRPRGDHQRDRHQGGFGFEVGLGLCLDYVGLDASRTRRTPRRQPR